MTDKERYATIGTWIEVFREEGAHVDRQTVRNHLNEAAIIGVTARNRVGRLLQGAFFAESDVRRVCSDFFNRLDEKYFSDASRILNDLVAYASQLGDDKTPHNFNTRDIARLSITCSNGKLVTGEKYILNAAVALELAKNSGEACSKRAETLRKLKEIANLKIISWPKRDTDYYLTQEFVLHDLTAYASQLGEGKIPAEITSRNIASLSITCHNGEIVKGGTYLRTAAIAFGLARNTKQAGSKLVQVLGRLQRIAGIEVRDCSYYQTQEFVLHDLTAYAAQLDEGKTPSDLSTKNIPSLSITCHNGEIVKGGTYLRNAAVALGISKNDRGTSSKLAETLHKLKEIATTTSSPESDDR